MHFGWSRIKAWLSRQVTGRHCRRESPALMARFSHELRTSLTGIVGYAEYLEKGSGEPMMNFTAKIIRESGENLARASRAFFDLYALQEGLVKPSCQQFVLSELAREVVKSHQSEAAAREVSLGFTSSEDALTPFMRADAERMRQVLDALVFGAVHAAQRWSIVHIDLSLDAPKTNWRVSVVTSGVPMNAAELELWRTFWRDDDYLFRLQEGPGVELALAKALIGYLGGAAEFQQAVGEPPRLCVMFPFHSMDPDKGQK